MLQKLGKLIEKRPWHFVIFILLITIIFSLFIPSLQFTTSFEDFAPDNELVWANKRITSYFGSEQQIALVLMQARQTQHILTPQALRDQYHLQQTLLKNPDIDQTVSLATLVDTVCLLMYNKTLENCTDEELRIAVHDLLTEPDMREIKLFQTDNPPKHLEYQHRLRRTKTIDEGSINIKNCYLSSDDQTITVSFEVYDISTLHATQKPPIPNANTMEWYLHFENTLLPPEYAMTYTLAVRMQPTYALWEVGGGVLDNLRQMMRHIRNRELFTTYSTQAYLWITPPDQPTSFAVPLNTGTISLDPITHRIILEVSRAELATFGIAPQFGYIQLPAKLSNFQAGVRYFQTPFLNRPGDRITVNTSYTFERIHRMHNRPLLGPLLTRTMNTLAGISWEEYETLSATMMQTEYLPQTVSLSALESLWTTLDQIPGKEPASTVFSVIPRLYDDLRINALAFVSQDYEDTKNPQSSLMILFLRQTHRNSDEATRIHTDLLQTIDDLNSRYPYIHLQVTGEGIVTTQINKVTMDANTIIGPMIFVIIGCILLLAFRKLSYVVLPILVITCSSIWLFGIMALLGITFSIIAVALLPINIGLGVEYSVNLLYNYRTELAKGKTPAVAIRRSIKDVGGAIFLAWFTTVVAFLSFLTATIPPIREFGIFLALGITNTFVISLTLLVSLRYIIDRRKHNTPTPQQRQTITIHAVMEKLACMLLRHKKIVFLTTIVLILLMGTAVSQLKTGFSMYQFIPEDNPSLLIFSQISEDFPYAGQDQEYILLEGNVATVQTLQGLAATHDAMDTSQFIARKTDGSPNTESIYAIIQQAITYNQTLVTQYNIDESTGIPRTDADVRNLYDYLYTSMHYSMAVQNVLHKQENKYTATIIRVYIDIPMDADDMTDTFEQLKTELTAALSDYGDVQAIVTGPLIVTLTILKNMTESQIISTAVCFLLAALMMSIIYRNPTLGLIAMIPVSISIVWVLGTMYIIGYSLNIMTITVTSITIGIGIDYACYITVRFRQIADKTGDITNAVKETISRSGSAIFIAALCSMFGFGILAFAPIPPQQQFGIITAITLIYTFLTSIFVLPLVLASWATWRKKRKGYIVSPGAPVDSEDVDDSHEYTGEQ